jgi:very-short-patch-repair endonuclease
MTWKKNVSASPESKEAPSPLRSGFRGLRFWNTDVLGNTEGVMESIRGVVLAELPTE